MMPEFVKECDHLFHNEHKNIQVKLIVDLCNLYKDLDLSIFCTEHNLTKLNIRKHSKRFTVN